MAKALSGAENLIVNVSFVDKTEEVGAIIEGAV